MEFEVALRMRNFAEFQARVRRGDLISFQELTDKYLPSHEDYRKVCEWLEGFGLTVTRNDLHHLGVFVTGSVAQVSDALGVGFARAAADGSESTVAITAPNVPSELAPAILGVNGLQPRAPKRRESVSAAQSPASPGALSVTVAGNTYTQPSDIATAYGMSGSNLTGAGQTIAIIIDAVPDTSDLTAFWKACGVSQSLANYTSIPVGGGPTPSGHVFEASLDVEWTSSLAPSAKIRVYAIPGIVSLDQIDQALSQIIADLPSNPGMNQISISIGLPESWYTPSQLQSSSQYLAVLASQGVTSFAGSGDGGSNPDLKTPEAYNPNAPLQVCYPGSDPYVIGVGGSTLALDSANAIASETVWGLIPGTTYPTGYSYDATGGGYSVFSRPAWQAGLNLPPGPAGAGRCVPDVAAPAVESPYALVIFNHGQAIGAKGTSWSTPIWAALCALINQARGNAGEPPLGLLAPKLYALPTGTAFRAVTSGTNGAYTASSGYSYNLCTGLGSPKFAALLTALVNAPTIATAPVGQSLPTGGSATLSVAASGTAPLTYQWKVNGSDIAGATSSTLTLSNVATTQAGNYSVAVTNSYGSVTSLPAAVAISGNARLVNISTRATVGTGANILISGLVTSGGNSKRILVRGIGPTLSQFGVSGVLARPQLTLLNNKGSPMATNTVWGGGQTLASAFSQVGAFALPANSADSAILMILQSGVYTTQVEGIGGTAGTALAEVYDADTGTPVDRLANFSSRAFVGTGGNILIAGFVISGTTSETVLIRGIGPTLGQFGVSGALANPQLTLRNGSGAAIATNAGWGGGAALASVFAQVGAFALPAGSADCALVLTLPPGSYTAQIAGANSSTGVALVEVYDVH